MTDFAEVIPMAPPALHALTDVRTAQRFVLEHGSHLRHVHSWSRWLHYDGGRWSTDETGEIERRAKETLRLMTADANSIADDAARKRALRQVIDAERVGRIRGMIDLARSEPGIPLTPAQLDVDPLLFNVENGTVHLADGVIRPHDPDDLITKVAPVAYDAAATAPRFMAFLEQIQPDPAVRGFLQRLVGYSMSGLADEQIIAILYGTGANGKSTFVELLRALLGDYGQQAPAETFLERRGESIPNDVARLRGARFVLASEIGEGRRLNEAQVKRMTGGDTMTARFMRGEWFEFRPVFTPWLVTNHKPEIRGTDEAIWRRLRLIDFPVTIPADERDPQLPAKLREELPGILNWAISGAFDWSMDGLNEPDAVTVATSAYRDEQDILGDFLADTCILTDDAQVKTADLRTAYEHWCQTNGAAALSAQALGRRLRDRGLTDRRTGNARWWKGIGLVDHTREEASQSVTRGDR